MDVFFDSHAHLADPAFDADREESIGRARDAGARGIICIGESLAAAARARVIAAAHPGFVWYTAGVHPHAAADFDAVRDVAAIRAEIDRGAVAVGECGLDYHDDHTPRTRQRRAFAEQLALARETTRPVVVHTRDAEGDTAAMIREAGDAGIRGVLHCFTGTVALADVALAAGWFVSFSGIITFKKWTDLALLRHVPDDRILAESDAPYLAPVPKRGKRNESAWVSLTVAALAAARNTDAATLGERSIVNARNFFALA